jgi:DNA-binding GntR family transcriptional regulator
VASGPSVGVAGGPGSVASARIADSLRAEILDGRYRPGERIRQEDLAARSGASRIPVREALRMLHAEGLVTLVANSGAWVSRLTAQECAETYLIRERLEPLLLRLSMPRLDQPAIDRLAVLADAMEREPTGAGQGVDAFLRADREFHLASYAGAEETQAWQIIHRMWNTTHHYRREFTRLAARASLRQGSSRQGSSRQGSSRQGSSRQGSSQHSGPGLEVTHMEHRLLVDCIRRADAEDAERVLVTHIRRTRLELGKHPEIFG